MHNTINNISIFNPFSAINVIFIALVVDLSSLVPSNDSKTTIIIDNIKNIINTFSSIDNVVIFSNELIPVVGYKIELPLK